MQLKGRGTVNGDSNRTQNLHIALTPYTLAAAAVISSRNSRFTSATNARHDHAPQRDPASQRVLQYRRTFRHARPREMTSLGAWGEHANCVLRQGANVRVPCHVAAVR
jgi:hypothetical protein